VGRISTSRALEKEHVIVGRRRSSRIAHDECAEEASALLAHFIEVRMIHEGARPRRGELHHERILWRDLRSDVPAGAAETSNAIHVAVLHLDAVPVDAGRLVEMVHDRDGNRDAARQIELGAETRPS
jgi:hypothetical protein